MTRLTLVQVRKRIPQFQRSGILSISASYDGDAREVGFTLSAYVKQGTTIAWVETKANPPYTNTVILFIHAIVRLLSRLL